MYGQNIVKKDLQGYWKYKTPNNLIRFYHFYESDRVDLYFDTISDHFTQATYSIREVDGETILSLEFKFPFVKKPEPLEWIIRRSSQDLFILKSAGFTKSGELDMKWKDISKQATFPFSRVIINKNKTTTL